MRVNLSVLEVFNIRLMIGSLLARGKDAEHDSLPPILSFLNILELSVSYEVPPPTYTMMETLAASILSIATVGRDGKKEG